MRQIETVERETGTVKIAGYSALELFLYSETGEGVASGVFHQRIVLNEGAFQLPMYMSLPQSGPMLAEAMHSLSKVEHACVTLRRHGASILLHEVFCSLYGGLLVVVGGRG